VDEGKKTDKVLQGSLGDAGISYVGRFNSAVKIDFESKCGGIEHGEAVFTRGQMALYFAGHLRREATFQVFAN
jgi:hypothetical protein